MTVLTYEEWLRLPEVEGIEEVVNSEIRKMPPSKILHADTVENLADLLKASVDRYEDSGEAKKNLSKATAEEER